jgi:hypothetical protein
MKHAPHLGNAMKYAGYAVEDVDDSNRARMVDDSKRAMKDSDSALKR